MSTNEAPLEPVGSLRDVSDRKGVGWALWEQIFARNWLPWSAFRRRLSHLGFLMLDSRLARRSEEAERPWTCLPSVQGEMPRGDGKRCVLLAFGDPVFIRQFAPALLASVARNSPTTHVHLHVFGTPEENVISPARQGVSLSLSWEDCDAGAMSEAQQKRYYQSMRFVRMAQFLENAGQPLLAIDIDSIVMKDLAQQTHFWSNADIGLITRLDIWDPGKIILAGAVFAAPTPAAKKFLNKASSRMLTHLLDAPYTEKLDQRCFYLSFCNDSAGVRIAPLPMSLASVEEEGAVILTFRGSRKRHHPGVDRTAA